MAPNRLRFFAWLFVGIGLILAGCPSVPPAPPAPTGVAILAAGDVHTCAALSDGSMKCWGWNGGGALGNGTNVNSNVPVEVSGFAAGPNNLPLLSIAAGGGHTCAVGSAGKILCWGANDSGQLGNGTRTSFNVMQPVARIIAATAVTAGAKHTCALQGAAVGCWGANDGGQLGSSAGSPFRSPVPVVVQGVTASVVAAGGNQTCVFEPASATRTANVRCWGGFYTSGSVPIPATAIAVGRAHACAIEPWGTVKCWGRNSYGQLGDGTRHDSSVPVEINRPGNIPAVALAAGRDHTCAVFQGGTVECWGSNGSGQTGDRATGSYTLRPVAVAGLSNATTVAAGAYHSCASFDDGGVRRVACWGNNRYGQLGNGTNTNSLTPVRVSGLP